MSERKNYLTNANTRFIEIHKQLERRTTPNWRRSHKRYACLTFCMRARSSTRSSSDAARARKQNALAFLSSEISISASPRVASSILLLGDCGSDTVELEDNCAAQRMAEEERREEG
eukprot:102832-Pleurochrysis_carterae.AAC.3